MNRTVEITAPGRAKTATHGPSALRKALLAAEVCLVYGRVRLLLRRFNTPDTVARLRSGRTPLASRYGADRPPRERARQLGRATVRVLAPLPVDSRCLLRSLVLARMMTRRGLPYEILFSVHAGNEFIAHCWVEADGVPMLDPGEADHAVVMRL